ncbi:Hypothetical predicted protein [Paramuricea clavata]|uniref:Uncharacterized protein n=1 Tax=Paramuricea clavata TaxID=317549 RepID=A0A7D9I8L0_PARCT|nr:Hypothetical predicted protein [Paramuricea clavata]
MGSARLSSRVSSPASSASSAALEEEAAVAVAKVTALENELGISDPQELDLPEENVDQKVNNYLGNQCEFTPDNIDIAQLSQQQHPATQPFQQQHPHTQPFEQEHPSAQPFQQQHPAAQPFQQHTAAQPFQQQHTAAQSSQPLDPTTSAFHPTTWTSPPSEPSQDTMKSYIDFMARRELIANKIEKFDDQPGNYHQLRSAYIKNPAKGVIEVWKKLDESFGTSIVITKAYLDKFTDFPNIGYKDARKLQELGDLLLELQCAKSDGSLPGLRILDEAMENHKSRNSGSRQRQTYRTEIADEEESRRKNLTRDPIRWCEKPHPLAKCRAFRGKSLEDRKYLLRKNRICFRCVASTTHVAKDCRSTVKCLECQSDKYLTIMHAGKPPEPKESEVKDPNVDNRQSRDPSIHGGENEATAKCTELCGNEHRWRSCSKICLANIYAKTHPEKKNKVFFVFDVQSNCTLAKPKLFDLLSIDGEATSYTLKTCAGKSKLEGRCAKNLVIESLEGRKTHKLPPVIECDAIPDKPCPNALIVKQPPEYDSNFKAKETFSNGYFDDRLAKNVFVRTENDDKPGMSVEDREFVEIIESNLEKNDAGNWNAPLPFRREVITLPESRGEAAADLRDKETELSNAFVSEGNGDREGDGVNTASTENSHIEINSHETSNYNNVLDSIRDLELCFVNKFDELLQEIRQFKTTEETISEDRNSLIKENGKLKQEIDILSDQVNNYKCIASDLNTKVKQLEDEQKSLITAIKIVQNDCNTNKQSTWSWNVVKNRKPNQNESTQRGQNSGENSHNGLAKTDNQYSVLVDESDDEINILSQSRLPKNRNQSEPPRHTIRSNEDKRRNYSAPRKQQADNDRNNNNNERAQDSRTPRVGQSRVAILGDSMLKQINARRIQQGMKHKIDVKTFPGAGIKEMNHYVKPTLLTAPNKLILHVGTNDLQRMTPDELLTHVQKLGESITRENGNIELVLSEIITRNDDKTLADKVNEYNKGLAQLCTERNWCLIRHNNIDVNHLNNYGLHLNKQGTSVLAKNIKQFLNRN